MNEITLRRAPEHMSKEKAVSTKPSGQEPRPAAKSKGRRKQETMKRSTNRILTTHVGRTYDELAQEMFKRADSLPHVTAKAEMARRAAVLDRCWHQ
jgi:hypothetical protein